MPERHRRGTGLVALSLHKAAAMIRAACAQVRLPRISVLPASPNCIESLESRTLLSTSWFVSPSGSDNNPGTITAPFHSIQRAANVAQAGDHVEIRAGVYHEDVVPQHSGTSSAPIVFEAYNGESVTVSGADRITGFNAYSGAIYKGSMGWDLGQGNNQVFVDGQMINEARWPNTS